MSYAVYFPSISSLQLLHEPSYMEIDELPVFFHLLDLAILNRYILLSSCGGKRKRFVINLHEK